MQKMFVDTISTICKDDYSPEQIKAWTSSIENTELWTDKLTSQHFLIAEIDNKIVGVYLVAEKSAKKFLEDVLDGRLDSHKNAKIFISKNLISDNGIQGIALCVDKDYRGLGIGNKLKS